MTFQIFPEGSRTFAWAIKGEKSGSKNKVNVMGRSSALSLQEQAQIDCLHRLDFSVRRIAAEIGRSRCAVSNYLSDPVRYASKKSPGRPPKLSSRQRREIVRKASNSMASANEIIVDLGLNVSESTVLRALHHSPHIERQRMKSAPNLTPAHHSARVDFAKANMALDWSKVRNATHFSAHLTSSPQAVLFQIIFSDEKKFNLDGPDGFDCYWRDLRKEPRVFSRRNFGGGSLMVWAGFSAHGRLEIAFPSCRMDLLEYQAMLAAHLLPYLRRHRTRRLIYQQDNAAIHVSRSTMAWFAANNVNVLDWAARSPDLNPQENLWGILVRKVYTNGKQYSSITDLKAAIIREWNNIDDKVLKALVNSMPNRIFAVISKQGKAINY